MTAAETILNSECARLVSERDDLLAALEGAFRCLKLSGYLYHHPVMDAARDAIAKAKAK